MDKLDYKRQYRQLYQAPAGSVTLVEVPAMNFLMIDGKGDPNSAPAYAAALGALYAVAYTIRFMIKRGPEAIDFGVMPLEGLWWADDMAAFATADKSAWQWTMMIMQPPCVTRSHFTAARAAAAQKKQDPAIALVRWEQFAEGRCAQIMHRGPFSEEGPTIERVHQYIDACGRRRGKHHEIYLSDIRKAALANLKTIIRQPLTLTRHNAAKGEER
ncbi:MAG TPA: GyrI-like domain-containing protein [bacterium]|nr:GyrI-like domain-containing protein [bacterium]